MTIPSEYHRSQSLQKPHCGLLYIQDAPIGHRPAASNGLPETTQMALNTDMPLGVHRAFARNGA